MFTSKFANTNIRWFFLLGLMVQIVTVYFSKGFHHTDEHNQVLEFSYVKWAGDKVIDSPTKDNDFAFDRQIRSWAQSGFYYLTYKSLEFFKITLNPFQLAFLFRLLSALFAYGCFFYLTQNTRKFFADPFYEKIYILLTQFLWFIPYINARTSSENMGASFFALALAFGFSRKIPNWFLIGICMGFSFLGRFQMGVSIFSYAVFIFAFDGFKLKVKPFIQWGLGLLGVILLGVIIDYWGYGKWTFSPWNYYIVNIVEDKLAYFGIFPWWHYLKLLFNKGIPPLSITLMLLVSYYWIKFPKNIYTWVTLPFFIFHSAVGHKELRFLFPLMLLSPFMIAKSLELLAISFQVNFFKKKLVPVLVGINLVALIIFMFRPAHGPIGLYEYMYNHISQSDIINVFQDKDNGEHIKFPYSLYQKTRYQLRSFKSIEDILKMKSPKELFLTRRNDQTRFFLESNKCQKLYSTYPLILFKYKLEKIFSKSHFLVLWECAF